VLILALALTFAAAHSSPNVESFNYNTSDWFGSVWSYFLYSIFFSYYAFVGFFAALFGDSGYFNAGAFNAINTVSQLPVYPTF
jgi:hypothetical protein